MFTETSTPEQQPGVFRRLALPFLLFSAVLAVLLMLSWVLLLPEVTRIEVDGTAKTTNELKVYRAQLMRTITDLKGSRNEYLLPLKETEYGKLTKGKLDDERFDYLFEQVRSAGTQLIADKTDIVSLKKFSYDASLKKAVVEGMIRNVGPQSMTVQAQYIEALRVLPGIERVDNSRYTRKEDPEIGFYSPFVIELFVE